METLNKYYKIAKSVYNEELTLAQYFEAFKTVTDAEQAIKAELSTKTVKVLKSVCAQLGEFYDSRHKKNDLINKAFDAITDYFLIGRGVSYFLGETTHKEAKQKLIEGTTAEQLNSFYKGRAEKKAAILKAIENPETLEEFRIFCSEKGKENLTPEQLARFEQLTADITLKRQEKEKEQNNTVEKIDNENVEFALHPTKHSKTGADIFTVLMINRVDREEFTTLKAKAKKIGGYYSRFTNLRATPPIKAGFNFDTEEDARLFMGLKEQEQSTADKQEAKEEEKQQTAAEKMKDRAEKMIEKAEESLNQERRTNTHRQAAQAASSEDKARQEIIFAKKLIKIAEGFENGTIKYLHALRNGKQLEQLESILSRGHYRRLSSMNLTYTERQNTPKEPFLDVNYIEYPYPTYGTRVLETIFLKEADTPGMKKGVKKILDYAKRNQTKNELVIFQGEFIIDTLKKTASKLTGKWDRLRVLDYIKDYERIQKMGLTNDAILKTALRELISLSEGTEISQEEKAEIELKELERSFISKKIPGFFPTPMPLINRMFNMAKVFEGETILEPSAGLGHIAQEIKNRYPDNKLNLIEYNGSLAEVLNKKGFEVENDDFLNTSKKYDVIFMNPPFEKHQDIEHVEHAYNLLNPGGRLVAIMAGNKNENSSNKKINTFLELVEKAGYIQQNEEGSFKSAFNSTNVNTITVYLEKPEEEEKKPLRNENGSFNIPCAEVPKVYDSAGVTSPTYGITKKTTYIQTSLF